MEKEIKDILANQYGIDDVLQIQKLSDGFVNFNHKIITKSASYVYRLCLQVSEIETLNYEVRLSKALAKINFPIAKIIPTPSNEYFVNSPSGFVVLSEFIEGSEPKLSHSTVKEIASAVAELNQFEDWKSFEKKNIIHMDNCHQTMDEFKTAPLQFPEIFNCFEEQTRFLEDALKTELPKGLIHGDVFPDNTLYINNKLRAIIDFEDACVDHLLMEVGMTINGFCFKNNILDENLIKTFLKTYDQIRPLTDLEWELLPHYIQWTAHGMLSWHLKCQYNRKEERQYNRVLELMQRVKNLRKKTLINYKSMIAN